MLKDAGEAPTRGLLVSNQALYHWDTALPGIGGRVGGSGWAKILMRHVIGILVDTTRDTSHIYENVKCVCFVYIQSQKMKFTSAQINMKQFSYMF